MAMITQTLPSEGPFCFDRSASSRMATNGIPGLGPTACTSPIPSGKILPANRHYDAIWQLECDSMMGPHLPQQCIILRNDASPVKDLVTLVINLSLCDTSSPRPNGKILPAVDSDAIWQLECDSVMGPHRPTTSVLHLEE